MSPTSSTSPSAAPTSSSPTSSSATQPNPRPKSSSGRKPAFYTPPGNNKGKGTSTATGHGGRLGGGTVVTTGQEAERERVVSSELRTLLSRDVIRLDKRDVKEHGGGVG